jgi:oligopeptide/dipeptide ABC transporter ATP-binding protein
MRDNSNNILTIDNLRVHFELDEGIVEAVGGISLAIKRGRTLAIVGESGCGKSVTAYSILKLIQKPGKIVNGKVSLYPQDREPIEITALDEKSAVLYEVRGGYISMIFQEPMTALSPVHTVGNQISEALRLHNTKNYSKSEIFDAACEILTKAGITRAESVMAMYPHQMSGGMRQRAVIAMAMVTKPELLIADEPTTALDVTLQAQIIGLIRQLSREFNTSNLLITHDLSVVAQTADDVAVMYLGHIVEQASVRRIIKHPMHPYTMALMASLPGLEKNKRLIPIKGSVPRPFDKPLGCPFHPRCQYAKQGLCDVGAMPQLQEKTEGHHTACLRIDEIQNVSE